MKIFKSVFSKLYLSVVHFRSDYCDQIYVIQHWVSQRVLAIYFYNAAQRITTWVLPKTSVWLNRSFKMLGNLSFFLIWISEAHYLCNFRKLFSFFPFYKVNNWKDPNGTFNENPVFLEKFVKWTFLTKVNYSQKVRDCLFFTLVKKFFRNSHALQNDDKYKKLYFAGMGFNLLFLI